MRDKLEQFQELANTHLVSAQQRQKQSYGKVARWRCFQDQQDELEAIMPVELFSTKPGCTDLIQHDIQLHCPNRPPIRDTTSRVPAKLMPALKPEVEDMLAMGDIEPSRVDEQGERFQCKDYQVYLSLQPCRFRIQYRPGHKNVVADFLSRSFEK
ncbi:unnamed protein product [Merluccius merluccius]